MAIKILTAVIAGATLAGSVIAAPAVGAPDQGRVATWGDNYFGQLGHPDSDDPVEVNGDLTDKNVTDISTSGTTTCAIADGKAYCWGFGVFGGLGNGLRGKQANSDTPVPVIEQQGVLEGRTVTSLSPGGDSTCAVADGKAFCWGAIGWGEPGDGTRDKVATRPVAVGGALATKRVSAISTGDQYACALAEGKAYCWGLHAVGDGTSASSEPVAVSEDSGRLKGKTVTAISAGDQTACAVADGSAFCWGYNGTGQVGDGLPVDDDNPYVTEPVAVARESGGLAGRTVTAISAGSTHVCAIADGRAFCWGDNFSGQLGTGTTTSSPRPVAVVIEAGRLRGRTVTDISAGDRTTCAVADARAFCWGDSSRSEPSIESADGVLVSLKPVPVDTSGVLAGQRVTRVVTGGGDTMAAVLFGAPPAPIRVKGVDVVVRKGTAKVTWKPVAGATAYGVRLSKPGGKGYQKWVSTAKPMLRVGIRKGKTYRVQVQAITPKARGVVTTFRFRAR